MDRRSLDACAPPETPVVSISVHAREPLSVSANAPLTPQVDVILPVYNEASVIARTFAATADFSRHHPGYRFTFVDDLSTDDTVAILRRLIAKGDHDRVRLIESGVHRGKARLLHESVLSGEGQYLCFIDSDGAYTFDHLLKLEAALADHDVAMGSRSLGDPAERNIILPRRVLGSVFNRLCRVILGLPYRDTQAGLKGFRRDAARRVFAMQRVFDFAFDAELVFVARRLGYRIAEVPAQTTMDHARKPSKVRLVRDPCRMFFSLLRIRLAAARGRYG